MMTIALVDQLSYVVLVSNATDDKRTTKKMTEAVPLKVICERIGVDPKDARIVLRKSDIQVETRRWEFPPAQARKVETLLRKSMTEPSPKKKKGETEKTKTTRPRKKIVVRSPESKVVIVPEAAAGELEMA